MAGRGCRKQIKDRFRRAAEWVQGEMGEEGTEGEMLDNIGRAGVV